MSITRGYKNRALRKCNKVSKRIYVHIHTHALDIVDTLENEIYILKQNMSYLYLIY